MADTVASCSDPCVIPALLLLVLIQPTKTLKQSTTMAGLNSTSAVIVARCFEADRWTALSKDVCSIHETHRRPSPIGGWRGARVRGDVPIAQLHTILTKATNDRNIAQPRKQTSAVAAMTMERGSKRAAKIFILEYQGRLNDDHHQTNTQQQQEDL